MAGDRPVTAVSGEKVFRDMTRELITWRTVLTVEETLACLEGVPTAAAVRGRLGELLGGLWRAEWAKAKRRQKPAAHPPQPYRRGKHWSVHRVLLESKQAHTPAAKKKKRDV